MKSPYLKNAVRAFMCMVAAAGVGWHGEAETNESATRPQSLVPATPQPGMEGDDLDRAAIFARIDSLEVHYFDDDEPGRALLAYRIGQLYLATGLLKHRRTGLEYLDTAIELDPAFFDAALLRATTRHSMRYTTKAEKLLEGMRWQFDDEPQAHQQLGHFHFNEARRNMRMGQYALAARGYAEAVAIDSTDANSTLALAACYVALGDYRSVPVLAHRLSQTPGFEQPGLLMLGAASMAIGAYDDAWNAFHSALTLADEETRRVYLEGAGTILDERVLTEYAKRLSQKILFAAMANQELGWKPDDGVDMRVVLRDDVAKQAAVEWYWRSVNPRPSHVSNESLLEYWQRLVEAEVLFGDPAVDRRGWEDKRGQAWVRWGPPSRMLQQPARWNSGGGYFWNPRFSVSEYLLPGGFTNPTSSWFYNLGPGRHEQFVLTFHRAAPDSYWWVATGPTNWEMEYQIKHRPVVYDQRFEIEDTFRMHVSTAAFYRPGRRASLECYLAVRPFSEVVPAAAIQQSRSIWVGGEDTRTAILTIPDPSPQASFLVEWAIYGDNEERLDFRQQYVGYANSLSELHASLGEPVPSGYDPILVQWAADMRPGRYRVAVDVNDLATGAHDAREILLDIPSRKSEVLSISDLEVASSFVPYQGKQRFPLEFIKHAFAVVPATAGLFASDAQTLYVYYEIYNLAQDQAGQTNFNVSYEVYRRQDQDEGPLTKLTRDGLSRVDPLGLTFLDETTGASAQKHVVKGGMVDISGLPVGRYVLMVTIEDLVGGAIKRNFTNFSKIAGDS